MRFFSTLLVAASALASLVAAQSKVIQFTKVPTTVVAGNSYTIEWTTTDNTTPITIKLRVGASNDLSDVTTLTTNASGGKFTWTPEKGLGDNPYYALEIIQGKEINYSGQISLTGGSTNSVVATASAASTASSASASSASASSASTLSTLTITSAASSSTASAASKSGSSSSGSATAATTKTTGTPTSSESAITAPTSTGAAAQISMGSSPMALIFGAVAAMAYLN